MNNLLHPYPAYQPRDYADFPDYRGECRLFDLQQFNGAVPADAILPNVDSKQSSINLPAVMKLIGNLQDLNNKLQAKNVIVDRNAKLLLDVQEYLQKNSTDRQKGEELADRLDKAIHALGGFKKAGKKTQDNESLILGLAKLRELLEVKNDTTGANCKAPMMGGTVP
jgi:hypothetical protein